MSPIGRVFIVINLILAGCFVGFAGTFLQRHTDYKTQFENKTRELADAETKHQGQIAALNSQLTDSGRELRAAKTNLETERTTNSGLRDDNKNLEQRLTDLQQNLASLNSKHTTLAQSIDQSVQKSEQAFRMAMDAESGKNEALNAKQAAEANLSTANTRISTLEGTLADANGQISTLQQDVRENDLVISIIRRKFPGALAMAQPDLKGVVSNVGPAGRILTVRLTANPGEADIKPGYTMAIYQGEADYKGEAVIQEASGEFLFCKVTKLMPGKKVSVGDDAATNVGL